MGNIVDKKATRSLEKMEHVTQIFYQLAAHYDQLGFDTSLLRSGFLQTLQAFQISLTDFVQLISENIDNIVNTPKASPQHPGFTSSIYNNQQNQKRPLSKRKKSKASPNPSVRSPNVLSPGRSGHYFKGQIKQQEPMKILKHILSHQNSRLSPMASPTKTRQFLSPQLRRGNNGQHLEIAPSKNYRDIRTERNDNKMLQKGHPLYAYNKKPIPTPINNNNQFSKTLQIQFFNQNAEFIQKSAKNKKAKRVVELIIDQKQMIYTLKSLLTLRVNGQLLEEKKSQVFVQQINPLSQFLIQPIKNSTTFIVADLRKRSIARHVHKEKFFKYFACTMRGQHAFVSGGCNDQQYIGDAFRLSQDGSIMSIASHILARADHALAAFLSRPILLATGGVLGTNPTISTNKCEMFMIDEGRWKEIESMRVARRWHAATPLRDQFIYVFCGDHNNQLLSSVQRFSVGEGKWSIVHIDQRVQQQSRWKRRALLACVEVSKMQILVFGQKDGEYPEALILSEQGDRLKISDVVKSEVVPYVEGYQDPAVRFDNALFTMSWRYGSKVLMMLDLMSKEPLKWEYLNE